MSRNLNHLGFVITYNYTSQQVMLKVVLILHLVATYFEDNCINQCFCVFCYAVYVGISMESGYCKE